MNVNKREYSVKLKHNVLHRTLWKSRFVSVLGTVVRQNTDLMEIKEMRYPPEQQAAAIL
jgi:hypothetical protein